MKVHKEGRKILLFLFIILLVINLLVFYFLTDYYWVQNIVLIVSIIFYLFILQFFRNPKIITEIDEKVILAPADGKVVVIEEMEENEYFKEKKKQVSIFMSPLNVHINRNPVSGIVKYFKYHAGGYKVAWHPKSSTENERTTIVIQLSNGVEILVRQIAGAVAKRIKHYISEGDQVIQGEEFGFIKFGSRVDVFLPPNAKIVVNVGDKTTAGKTIIAELDPSFSQI